MWLHGIDSLRESRFSNKINSCSNIAYLFLLLYFIDLLSLGAGKLTEIAFGISSREVFFALVFLFAIPVIWRNKREILANLFIAFVGLFLCIVVINGARGWIAGNSSTIIMSDIKGYLCFFLLPAAFVLLYSRERIEFLLKTVIVVCGIWAFCSVILSYFTFFNPVCEEAIRRFLEENVICSLTRMGDIGIRVFFNTASRWMFPAFMFATYFLVFRREKSVWYMIAMVLFVVSVFIAYSRSFCLGVAVCVVLFLILCTFFSRKNLKRLLGIWGITLICATVVLGTIGISQQFNVFETMIARSTIAGEAVDTTADHKNLNVEAELDSNKERSIKTAELVGLIKKSPVAGNGLGARIAYGNGYVEYFYLDTLAKIGILGLVSFLLPFLYGTVTLYRTKERRSAVFHHVIFAGIFYFLIISYFNPCLNSVTGLSLYVLFLTIGYIACNHEINILDGESRE